MQLNFDLNNVDDTPINLLNGNGKPKELLHLPDDCIITDVETTGLNPLYDSIIEISALKIYSGAIQDKFSTLINPKRLIPPFISNLTGITNEMILNAPKRRCALIDFCNFIGNFPIIGHNIKFDISFINAEIKREFNKTLFNDFADTLFFSRRTYLNLENHKLTTIAKHLNLDCTNAHRALKDCLLTYEVYRDIKQKEKLKSL